jgi:hypothetical protein
MNSKYPYLDPAWIPIMKDWVQPPNYDPNQTSEMLARNIAYVAGKLDLLSKMEAIVRLQEKNNGSQ